MTESPSFFQAKGMEEFSGVELENVQRGLYIALRDMERFKQLSDQEVMVEVLKITDGDIKKFKQAYPEIFRNDKI